MMTFPPPAPSVGSPDIEEIPAHDVVEDGVPPLRTGTQMLRVPPPPGAGPGAHDAAGDAPPTDDDAESTTPPVDLTSPQVVDQDDAAVPSSWAVSTQEVDVVEGKVSPPMGAARASASGGIEVEEFERSLAETSATVEVTVEAMDEATDEVLLRTGREDMDRLSELVAAHESEASSTKAVDAVDVRRTLPAEESMRGRVDEVTSGDTVEAPEPGSPHAERSAPIRAPVPTPPGDGPGAWLAAAAVVAVVALGAYAWTAMTHSDQRDAMVRPTTTVRQPPPSPGPVHLADGAPEHADDPAPLSRLEQTLRAIDSPGATGGATTAREPGKTDEPDDLAAKVEEAEKLYKKGRRKAAAEVVDEILGLAPDTGRALVLRANLLIEDGKLDEALTSARASVNAAPELADGHLAVGVILQEQNQNAGAVVAYERYLELAPQGLYARSIKRQLERLRARVGAAAPADG